jgi:hypothetical protein
MSERKPEACRTGRQAFEIVPMIVHISEKPVKSRRYLDGQARKNSHTNRYHQLKSPAESGLLHFGTGIGTIEPMRLAPVSSNELEPLSRNNGD